MGGKKHEKRTRRRRVSPKMFRQFGDLLCHKKRITGSGFAIKPLGAYRERFARSWPSSEPTLANIGRAVCIFTFAPDKKKKDCPRS